MVHTWKETGEINAPDKRTGTALKKSISESGIDRLVLWPPGGKHETAIAIRIDGIREVLDNHAGVFGKPNWVTGTGDFNWWIFDGELWVDDLKTGKVYPDEDGVNRFPQDPTSAQIKCYALASASLLKYTGTVHVSVTHWPRLPLEFRHKEPERLWATFTTEELIAFWGDLERMYREAESTRNGDYVLSPGDHCRFCPSKKYCLVAQPDPEPYRWTRRD
jgi:hypothetical protein